MNKDAVEKLLNGIEGWVCALDRGKPSPDECSKQAIVAVMLVNILEVSLDSYKSQVESYLPTAFNSIDIVKKVLMLKFPQLPKSLLEKIRVCLMSRVCSVTS